MRKSMVLQGAALMFGLITLGSCSGDGNSLPGPVTPQGKNYKFTITVTGSSHDESDYVSFVFASGGAQNESIWKVNGAVQTNQQAIGLDVDDFAATTTYVIESTKPLQAAQANVQCINFDTPYIISFKAEVDGQVKQNDQNITVSENNDYTHDFTF